MKRVRKHLTYANVMSTLAAFLVLTGATAFAAQQLGKKTVGTKQLKANAVTTAKLKKNAVTKAKIKAGAVDTEKIADGTVTGADLNTASTPFSRIVHQVKGTSTAPIPNGVLTVYPLDNPTYTQEAGRNDTYIGAVDVTVLPSCEEEQQVVAFLLVDAANPLVPTSEDIAAAGVFQGKVNGGITKRINLGPFLYGGVRFQPATATNHTMAILMQTSCKKGSGVNVTSAAIDVIGTK